MAKLERMTLKQLHQVVIKEFDKTIQQFNTVIDAIDNAKIPDAKKSPLLKMQIAYKVERAKLVENAKKVKDLSLGEIPDSETRTIRKKLLNNIVSLKKMQEQIVKPI